MVKEESQFIKDERRRLQKMLSMKLLPTSYKKLGIGILITSILSLIAIKIFADDMTNLKAIIKNIMLISLLIMSISRDKVEDELTVKLRSQSYSMSFIITVAYALLFPFFELFVFAIFKPEKAIYSDISVFEVLFVMLAIQLLLFKMLKKSKLMRNSLKIERAIQNITQEELAKMIGVSRQTVNSIEKNRYIPSTLLALKISRIFHKSVNEIFKLDEND